MKKVVLYSGGLDSFCMASTVKPDLLVYFDIGLPEQQAEMEHIKAMEEAKALPAPIVFDNRFSLAKYKLANEVMPFRNLFFVAAGFTYGDKLYLGKTASSRNLDKNATFAAKALDVLKYISQNPDKNPEGLRAENMEILLPFDNKTKSQFVAEYLERGDNVGHLLMTRSCYKPYGKECGACQSCIRKSIALVNNGLFTRDMFEEDPRRFYYTQYEAAVTDGLLLVVEEIKQAINKI